MKRFVLSKKTCKGQKQSEATCLIFLVETGFCEGHSSIILSYCARTFFSCFLAQFYCTRFSVNVI